ncbi:S9 family peptidase [Paraferrimonas sp. SM1919]|uniref:S9 family peptidase n=1 Tax=Paraferrimonas sp. SM1919 TaxID=2662263 RepID=UPI0013D6D2D5|nr:S9 family peptidase [Paraferrimonas sp. SM1919]
MKKLKLSLVVMSIGLSACSEHKVPTDPLTAPIAQKIPHKMTAHGHTRTDNYYWMRDDERKDAKILAHLQAENNYAKAVLAPNQALEQTLYDEMIGRLEKDKSSVPAYKDGYYYYSRYNADSEYPIYARKKGALEAAEQLLLDGNVMAAGHEYFAIGGYDISPDQQTLAYATDTLSRRIYTIEFKSLDSDKKYPDKLEGTTGQVLWANDNKSVYYIVKDKQTLLGNKVYRHTFGTEQDADVLVYEQKDPTFYIGLGQSKDNQEIYVYQNETTKSGMVIINANNVEAAVEDFTPITEGHEFNAQKLGDHYYIHTNLDATNFKIVKVHQSERSDTSKWQDVIAHNPDVYIQYFNVFNNHLVRVEKEQGLQRVIISQLDGSNAKEIKFNDEVFNAGLSTNLTLDADAVRVYYSSPTTPTSIYDVDLNSLEKTLKKQDKVLGEFTPSDYIAKRIFITARDGAKVPVTISYRNDTYKQDGSAPLYQYGYGSYGATMDPSFVSHRLSLMDRGFIIATAHIRGSQMLGRPWYEDGKMFNKINTFNDFIDVTKGLTAQKYANADKVYAAGGSAGGLLMGAVINDSPELYHGVAAHVPFVDVVTTMSDASIPLTTGEWAEWGNPENKDSYEYMLSYSPYDQVKAIDYPNLLVTTGLHDSQVQYFEPMKWVAKLREYKTDDNILVFDTDMEAGHGGASGRFKRYLQRAQEYAFFINLSKQ